ncbi:MAG: DMT family transporter [Promethearchaeota archaeon]
MFNLNNSTPKKTDSGQMSDYILLVIAMFFWGGSWVAGKIASDLHAPLTAAFWRFFIASLVLIPILWLIQNPSITFSRRDAPHYFFLGATGALCYNFFFLVGLRYTTASSGSLIAGANPILISVFAILFLGESLRLYKVIGFLSGAIGVILVVGIDALEGTGWEGNLLIFCAMIMWSTYSTRLKQLSERNSSLELTTYSCICGTVLLFPLALLEGNGELYKLTDEMIAIWGGIIFLGVFATSVSFTLFNRSLEKLGNSRSAIFINLVPMFGTMLSILLLDETFTLLKVVGLIFVILGVITVNYQYDQLKKLFSSFGVFQKHLDIKK